MNLTETQEELLKRTIKGVDVYAGTEEDEQILYFLQSIGFCKPFMETADRTVFISELGKAYLETRKKQKIAGELERSNKAEASNWNLIEKLAKLLAWLLGLLHSP